MKVFKKIVILSLILVLGISLLSACNKKEQDSSSQTKQAKSNDAWEDIKEKGILKVGLCPEYPPFESINKKGDIEGFDAELANEIGKELGVKVELVNTPWEGLISGLNNGNFDLIMSAMSPEEATKASNDLEFSNPYYKLSDIIAVKKYNNEITKKEDLNNKTVGYQTGSASEQAAEKLKDENINVKAKNPYNRTSDAFAELENGRIDAVIVSFPYAVTQSNEDRNFKVVNDPIQQMDIVAIAKKGNTGLIKNFNDSLEKIKKDGRYKKIEDNWLSIKQ